MLEVRQEIPHLRRCPGPLKYVRRRRRWRKLDSRREKTHRSMEIWGVQGQLGGGDRVEEVTIINAAQRSLGRPHNGRLNSMSLFGPFINGRQSRSTVRKDPFTNRALSDTIFLHVLGSQNATTYILWGIPREFIASHATGTSCADFCKWTYARQPKGRKWSKDPYLP